MEKIVEWLSNPKADYYEGISLLQETCKNKTLLIFLQRKENQQNRGKLTYELQKLLGDKVEKGIEGKNKEEEAKTPKQEVNTEAVKPQKIEPEKEESDEPSEEILQEKKRLFQERQRLSNELVAMDSDEFLDEQRKAKFDEIQNVIDQYNALAGEKMLSEENASTGDESLKKTPETLDELKVARQPLMEKRSKLTAKLKKSPNSSKSTEWQTEIAKVQAEIDAINEKIELLK